MFWALDVAIDGKEDESVLVSDVNRKVTRFTNKNGVTRVSATVYVNSKQDDLYVYGVKVEILNNKHFRFQIGRFNRNTENEDGFMHRSVMSLNGEVHGEVHEEVSIAENICRGVYIISQKHWFYYD